MDSCKAESQDILPGTEEKQETSQDGGSGLRFSQRPSNTEH